MTQTLEHEETTAVSWRRVCHLSDLEVGWGEAALVAGEQVALFRVGPQEVHAVGHRDPATGAHVIARGIVGSRLVGAEHRPTIASPLHKQVYDLRTGECYTDPALRLPVHPCRVRDGWVEIAS